jgi:branched-subunit amino acid aminotransferase/4-amino-4-deoxychorismate lyase
VIIKDDKLISPDVDSGPVDGVMLKVLAKTGYKIERRAFDFQEVIDADHIFLCNAVKGVRWVNSFNGIEKSYWPEYPKMVQKLNVACGLKD